MDMEEKSNVQDSQKDIKPKSPEKRWVNVGLFSLGALILIGVVYFSYMQRHKINSLQFQNANLTAKNNQLTKSNKSLATKNSILQKSVQALANPKKQSTTTTSVASSVSSSNPQSSNDASKQPVSNATLTINSVQMLTPSYFGDTAPDATTDQVRVVFVTMKNLTSAKQTYSVLDFSATTSTGAIVKPRVYAGPGMGSIWNNSTLAPGGSTTQPLLFDASDNIVTLQWAPAGSDSVSLSVPPIMTN